MTVLSPDQSKALDQVLEWHSRLNVKVQHCNGATDCPNSPHTHGEGPAPVFAVGGWAGSGKTTLMRELEESIQAEVVFGAPTHKAANVLRKKLGASQAERVRTYHSLTYDMSPIYRCTTTKRLVMAVKDTCVCKSGEEDGCLCPMSFLPCGTGTQHKCSITAELRAEKRRFLYGHRDLVIIDESSMLSRQHVEDLRAFGVPVILVGDAGQLPPIDAPMNPWTMKPDVELTEIHRQGADSGILQAAHDVRRNGFMSFSSYGSPKPDAVRMARSSQQVDDLLMRFNPATDGALITWTNKLKAQLNRLYHTKLVGAGPVAPEDRVVALGGRPYEAARVVMDDGVPRSTGEFVHVHNGMTGKVLKASERGVVTELTVELDDHPLAKPDQPVIILSGAVPTAQFGADKELAFNAPERPKGTHLWDYAYALTAHKAQGSEYRHVIVADQHPMSYRQWMYTALTRAQEGVVVVDWAR